MWEKREALRRVDVTYLPCAPKLLKVATPLNVCLGMRPGILASHNELNAARATRRVCDNILKRQTKVGDMSKRIVESNVKRLIFEACSIMIGEDWGSRGFIKSFGPRGKR